MDPEVREGLERSWKALLFVGILAIVVGCIAILVPAVAAVGTAIFIGWILLIAGAFLVAAAFSAHSIGTVVLRLLWAALTVIVGVWLIVEPHNGTLTLTLVLGIYFLFMGITRIAVAFAARGQQNAGLVGLSGVAGLLIGILVLAKFPSSADWAIGLLVGIDLIFAGWTLTSVALVGKDLARSR
ncbi:MAG TPA: HdeD family acid-resistance protein [Solirubrobacterales bacterium]|nr:HdeD family acid-resistance protein [Solirubrobacterales bacterium]